MKNNKKILRAIGLMLLLTFVGCNSDKYYYDDVAPSAPRNIQTVTGDNRVDIGWQSSPERDVAGYNIYFGYSYDGKYELIGNSDDNFYVDYGAENGVTYYYAVTAFDYNGNESELSYDVVYDTPRPEGFNQSIFDYINFADNSGYNFEDYLVVAFDDDRSDFFFENFNGDFYLDVWSDSDIQDLGSTNDIYDIDEAPLGGWQPLYEGDNVKYVPAILGHTYVIWTWDNHYAKVRIKLITSERLVFDWAYQTVEGNPELKTNRIGGDRNVPHVVIKN